MADDVEILTLEDRERWEVEHGQGGFPSQSWAYAWGLSATGYNPRLAIIRCRGARMLLPYFERSFMGTTDVATLPGLSGASLFPNDDSRPLGLWREYAKAQGWIAGYIQLSLFVQLDRLPPDSQLVQHNVLFTFDLTTWTDRAVSRNFRRKIFEAPRRGALLIEDPSVLAGSLGQLYPEAMRRFQKAKEFSSETLMRWAIAPSSLILGVSLGGIIQAVHLGCVAGEHAEWHVGATTEVGRSLATWIYWNAIERLRSKGVRYFNVGGAVRHGDGIFRFKERYGATPYPLFSVRQIYDRLKYDELCYRVSLNKNWFPAYRSGTGVIS